MIPSDMLPQCPECGHILTHTSDGYHCGYCGRYYTVAAGVMVEVQPRSSEPDPDDNWGLRRAIEKLKRGY